MISQTTEYALRAIVVLAAAGRPVTAVQIAERSEVPVGYLAKIMRTLSQAGLVRSQRGLHGGFTFLGDPADVSVLQVVQAIGPVSRSSACPLAHADHSDLCPLHRLLDDTVATIEQRFAWVSVADLLAGPGPTPLCVVSASERVVLHGDENV